VSILESLKSAETREDLAKLLGFKTSTLSYLLYKVAPQFKYTSFTIAKANGKERQIDAPIDPLKLLQRRLANLLYACCDELEREHQRQPLSHGFRKKRSIVTNAQQHHNRRYVLNLDLQDFFPSINFGRVRGFFLKNKDFELKEKVATAIAQIACHNGALPQGSPSSPILSDLITHILDVRLAGLAKKHRVTYSRYADDLTFSTNQKHFPTEIAALSDDEIPKWLLGQALVDKIENTGFAINLAKTRMQYRDSRQTVTGLVVNQKVNIAAGYYKLARSMCHSLFLNGKYYRPVPNLPIAEGAAPPIVLMPTPPVLTDEIAPLEGILSHIHHVKNQSDRRTSDAKRKHASAARELYRHFLFYKTFIALRRPLILCEGKTDNIYMRYAMRQLTAFHPALGVIHEGKFKPAVNLFGYTNQAHDILRLSGGTPDIKYFLEKYADVTKRFRHTPRRHPVIILIDNDDGAKEIFALLNGKFGKQVTWKSDAPFYHIIDNFYLVKTPEMGSTGESCVESLFEPHLLKIKLEGKSFNSTNKKLGDDEYGKYLFAEKIIKPNYLTVNFNGFAPLLERIVQVMNAYQAPIIQL
jgi:RNA-directed DNA polymerase